MALSTEEIWRDYHSELKNFVRSKVKDRSEADDIVQEIFIKVHSNLKQLREPSKVRQWIYQIARNSILDYFRASKEALRGLAEDIPQKEDESTANHKFALCLTSFMELLPEKYKEALTLVELRNLSQLELAKKLNISYSGAKSRVQRGRDILKSHFLNCCTVISDKYGNIITEHAKSKCKTCQPDLV